METMAIEESCRQAPPDAASRICSLAAQYDPDAALAAARRLYEKSRSGLRFFCENRRVISVEELAALDEAERHASPPRFTLDSSAAPCNRDG